MMSLAEDFGEKMTGEVRSDSSAAIGIASRAGLGKLRHLETHTLWVQQKVRDKQLKLFKLFKLPGKENPSDLMTKHKTARM